jgi:hypothetical protein
MSEEIQTQLRTLFAGRSVILAGDVAAGATGKVEALQKLGVERVLVIANGRGTGRLPDEVGAELVVHELPQPENIVAAFRMQETMFRAPPAAVTDALARFDPERESILLVAPFFDVRAVGDRPAFGARRAEWVALEDKTCNDALFDAARVARPPSAIVPVEPGAIADAVRGLDRGDGTVWSGDARDGFNGGGVFVRWVRDDTHRDEALSFFGPRCDRIRIAAFVEGIPCSIHGLVTDDAVGAFRPVEAVTLRAPRPPRLRYAGCATYFDPSPDDTATMRAAVRRLGARLRSIVDFRGVFTIDGIVSDDGFVATECNPRFGAALGYALGALPDLPLLLLHYALVERAVSVSVPMVEEAVMRAGTGRRWGGAWIPLVKKFDTTEKHDCGPDATLTLGPGPLGGFLLLDFDADRTPAGPSIAPRVVEVLAHADAEFDLGLGPLAPAINLR